MCALDEDRTFSAHWETTGDGSNVVERRLLDVSWG